ncbi:MAG: MATE family efflux transporter [Turicibacter sanguinis]
MHHSLQTTNISKLLLKYCIPAIISMMTVSLYNAVDRIFIGHIQGAGSLALTGLGTLIPFTTIILACELLITYGAIANLSLRLGEQKKEEAEDFLNQVPLLGLIISIFLMIVFYLFNEPLLYLFGATSDTIGYAKDYLNILTIGIPFYIMGFSLMGIIRSEGDPKRAALILMASCLINIILDPLFIFGLNLGISGAALATILSQATVFLYVVYYYTRGASNLKLDFKKLKIQHHLVKPIITFGLSTALIQLISAFVQILLNQSLKHYGTALSIGSFTTISTIYNLVMMPVVGINQGMIPIIGYNFGQRNYTRVKKTFLQGTIASTIIFTLGFLLIYILPTPLVSFFNPDKTFINTTVTELKLYAFSLPLCALSLTAPNFFQSIGNSKLSIWLVIIRQMIILIPALIILPRLIGLNGVWLAQPITDLSVSLLCFFLIKTEFKRLSSVN